MAGIKDQENIDELKKRLYERGSELEKVERHNLTPRPIEVSRGWEGLPGKPIQDIQPVANEVTTLPEVLEAPFAETEIFPVVLSEFQAPATKPKKRYRLYILLASLGLFILTTAVSSIFLFFGSNQISARNISITLNAPFAIAGGEILPMQISISNQNSVPINSAILIINYPSGARSVEEGNRELYEERLNIDPISPGQAINIPVRAILTGEENESKEIKVSIEYKVEGSNGTFFKEADPQVVQISSSPVVIRVTGVDKISSGQILELKIQLQSNAGTPQKNILVSASYPNNFSFNKSDPETAYGQNSWLIDELKSGETKEIIVRGTVAGLADELSEMQIKAGNPQLDNQFIMGSVLSQTKFSYVIEQAFTGVVVEINGDSDGSAVLDPNTEARVNVKVTNTLKEAIYDMRVEISPKGNIIRDDLLTIDRGFYDSNTQTIKFDVSGDSNLAEIKSGETRIFSFGVKPDAKQNVASFDVSASVYARRVNEARAVETLIGTALAEAKYSSSITYGRQLGYSDGPFTDTGPVPPVAGKATTYTITMVASAGVNDVSGGVVTTKFPQYIDWQDQTEGDGQVEFNPVAKELSWMVGDISSNQKKTIRFQVSLLPSVTQVGRTSVIMGKQDFRATDRFTGVSLQAGESELSNELSTELGFVTGNGIIQPKQIE